MTANTNGQMSENSTTNNQAAGEPENVSGYLTTKIEASNPKKPSKNPRARGKGEAQIPQYVAKVYKKRAKLSI